VVSTAGLAALTYALNDTDAVSGSEPVGSAGTGSVPDAVEQLPSTSAPTVPPVPPRSFADDDGDEFGETYGGEEPDGYGDFDLEQPDLGGRGARPAPPSGGASGSTRGS
jgi:hypothetical protein